MNEKMHMGLIEESEVYYVCNKACGTTNDKLTSDWSEVTCKNCLRWREKHDPKGKD